MDWVFELSGHELRQRRAARDRMQPGHAIQLGGELRHIVVAVHEPGAIGPEPCFGTMAVFTRGDFAHDGFEQIHEGDQAGEFAIQPTHERDVLAGLFELFQHLQNGVAG